LIWSWLWLLLLLWGPSNTLFSYLQDLIILTSACQNLSLLWSWLWLLLLLAPLRAPQHSIVLFAGPDHPD
jgi:hypothetical protein